MARPLSQAARASMLEAATALALDVGVQRFTIDEVSSRSGIARTTIYRHFPTRNQLLVAALDALTPVPSTPDTGTLRGDLLAFLDGLLPIFTDEPVRALFLDILAAACRDPELLALQQSMMEARSGPSRTIYERGRARGEIAADIDFDDAFLIFEAPLVMRGIGPPGSLDGIDLALHVDRMLLVLGRPQA